MKSDGRTFAERREVQAFRQVIIAFGTHGFASALYHCFLALDCSSIQAALGNL